MKRIGTGSTSLFRHRARLVILLSLVAALALAGCAGRQGVGASESWSGVATQPGTNTAFVGTRDGRVIELLLDVGRNDRIIPRVGAIFDANERAESGNRVDAAFYGTPTIAGDRVYFGAGALIALELKSGTEVWRFETGAPITASPAVAAGRLVIGATDGVLYCFGQKAIRQ